MKTYAKCKNCQMMFVPMGERRDYCGRDCSDVAHGIGRRPEEPTQEEIAEACRLIRESWPIETPRIPARLSA